MGERQEQVRQGFSGAIPSDLAGLTRLTQLYLSGNDLTGCVPPALRDVPENDLNDLSLPDCP